MSEWPTVRDCARQCVRDCARQCVRQCVRQCAAAIAGEPHDALVAPDPGPVDFSDRVELDAQRYPTLEVPAACAAMVLELAERIVHCAAEERACAGAAGAGGASGADVVVTGLHAAGVVAVYACACARAALAHRGTDARVTCVVFGAPLALDAAALGAVNVALTSDAECMYPAAASRRTVWLGEKDAAYYAARFLAVFVRPVSTATASDYAEAVRGAHGAHDASAASAASAAAADDEWHYVRP
jgi:hypothetical protein